MVPLLPSRPSRVDFVSSRALTSSVVSSDAFILSMSLNLTETLILVLYFFVLSILAIYGWHRYYLVYLYMKHKGNAPKPLPEPATLTVAVTPQSNKQRLKAYPIPASHCTRVSRIPVAFFR